MAAEIWREIWIQVGSSVCIQALARALQAGWTQHWSRSVGGTASSKELRKKSIQLIILMLSLALLFIVPFLYIHLWHPCLNFSCLSQWSTWNIICLSNLIPSAVMFHSLCKTSVLICSCHQYTMNKLFMQPLLHFLHRSYLTFYSQRKQKWKMDLEERSMDAIFP